MSYTNQQIAKLIAQNLAKNKQPIFQKGYTTSTGINRQINVNVGGKVVRALGWNVDTPGEVNVFWDAQNKRYVAWKEDTRSLKRKVVLSKRKVRPDDKKITILYNFVVAQDGGLIEGFARDVDLDLDGYLVIGITNTGDGWIAIMRQQSTYEFRGENQSNASFVNSLTNWIPSHLGNGLIYLFAPEFTISQRTVFQQSSSFGGNFTTTNIRPPIANIENFSSAGLYEGIWVHFPSVSVNTGSNLTNFPNGSWSVTATIFTNLDGVETQTGVATSTTTREQMIPGHDRNKSSLLYLYYTYKLTVIGSAQNTYKKKFYISATLNNQESVIGVEDVNTNYSINVVRESACMNYNFTGGYNDSYGSQELRRYISGSETFTSTMVIDPIVHFFADINDKTFKNISSATTISYTRESFTRTMSTVAKFEFILPMLVGVDCSLYLKQEFDVEQSSTTTSTLDKDNYLSGFVPSPPEDGYTYTVSSSSSNTVFNKKSICSYNVKVGNTYYEVSDFSSGEFSFGERYFLAFTGSVALGENIYSVHFNDQLDSNGKEYDVGIRKYSAETSLYQREKWGCFTEKVTKRITDGIVTEHYPVTPIEFVGLEVFVHQNKKKWKGTIIDVEFTIANNISFEPQNDCRRYTSFTINIEEELDETFFAWSGYQDTIFVAPLGDYSLFLLKFLENMNLPGTSWYTNKKSNLYIVTDENDNETVELAIAQIPTDTAKQKEHYADIYRFNTTSLKWERRPNAVSAISQLSTIPEHISYHPTPINKERKKRF